MREINQLSNGKIYRIICNITKKVYIGSTCEPDLNNRLRGHVNSYNRYKKHGGASLSSFQIIEHGDYKIELLEEHSCNSRKELCKREGELVQLYRCVNTNMAGRDSKEYYQDNRTRLISNVKAYQQVNQSKIKAKSLTYITCDCGRTIKYGCIYSHKKSKKHLFTIQGSSEVSCQSSPSLDDSLLI